MNHTHPPTHSPECECEECLACKACEEGLPRIHEPCGLPMCLGCGVCHYCEEDEEERLIDEP